jgi:hypothetical protein
MKHLAVRAEVAREDLMLMLQTNETSHCQVYDPAHCRKFMVEQLLF